MLQTLRRVRTHTLRRALIAALGLACLGVAEAQIQLGPSKVYVSDTVGSNANNGTEFSPWRTITHALSQVGGGSGHTIIMVGPGVYTEPKNGQPGEAFPLVMKKNVSLQGAGALDTVLRSEDDASALLLFRATTAGAFDEVFVDGFNINHEAGSLTGLVGVRIENTATATFPANPTISNCFITDHSEAGIDIVSAPGGHSAFDLDAPYQGFIPHNPRILFCTFRFNKVGVRATTSVPVQGFLRGLARPGLLNCLFKDQTFFDPGVGMQVPGDDLQGITFGDTAVDQCQYVIFERENTLAGAPIIEITESRPTSMVSMDSILDELGWAMEAVGWPSGTPCDCLFIDDLVAPPLYTKVFDLRLNPWLASSALFPSPVDLGLDPGASWVWDNGTTGKKKLASAGDAFDLDCEGYGNDRLDGEGYYDIGADEVGTFVVAGFDYEGEDAQGTIFPRFEKRFFSTDSVQTWIRTQHPTDGSGADVNVGLSIIPITTNNKKYRDWTVWGHTANLRPRGSSTPFTFPGFLGDSFISASATPGFTLGVTPVGYPTQDFGPHAEGLYNHQLALDLVSPVGSDPETLSNLQTYWVDDSADF